MLSLELLITRIFSVLFYYHYSFFAVSLAMSGLAFGGLLAARWDVRNMSEEAFKRRLAILSLVFSGDVIAALAYVLTFGAPKQFYAMPSLASVAVSALIFLPAMITAGGFLAVAFSRREEWIGKLYAADLASAALACIGSIPLMRIVQGPAALLAPALLSASAGLALVPPGSASRLMSYMLTLGSLGGMIGNVATGGQILRFSSVAKPLMERWNEHSRVIVINQTGDPHGNLWIVIDKIASTLFPEVPRREPGGPIPKQDWRDQAIYNIGYSIGRPLEETAVIGVGGGRDLLAGLEAGAKHIDGYELNQSIIEILRTGFPEYNNVASWPEISLIHDEARVGIKHSGKKYDFIQASFIDTWAATAAGGFVMSENGLYTVEGWETFLDSLSERGVITMSRWFIPAAPAEMHRLVSVAVTALDRRGIRDAQTRVMLVGSALPEKIREHQGPKDYYMATIIVSQFPFAAEEVRHLQAVCKEAGLLLMAAPGMEPFDPVVGKLLDPQRRAEAIAQSPFDISAPTDLRPYFFFQMRPRDALIPGDWKAKYALDTSYKAIQTMIFLCLTSLALALGVLLLAWLKLPRTSAARDRHEGYRWMSLYFFGIGLGYILIQLGLLQRLIISLGRPTYALSVVLFSMLLGTGIGSALSRRFGIGNFLRAWMMNLAVLAALVILIPYASLLDNFNSAFARFAAAAGIMGMTGLVMGFQFPLGIRLVASIGENSVQKMWAINGAASIAGSTLAALVGLGFGCKGVLLLGFTAYLLVTGCGMMAQRRVMASNSC